MSPRQELPCYHGDWLQKAWLAQDDVELFLSGHKIHNTLDA